MSSVIEFDASKLLLEEVTCHACGETNCTPRTCSFSSTGVSDSSYADVVRMQPIQRGVDIPEIKGINMKASDLKYLKQSIVGQFDSGDFRSIVNILSEKYLDDFDSNNISEMIDKLKSCVSETNRTSVVGRRYSDEQIVDTSVRNSISIDFNHTVVDKLSEIVEKKLVDAFNKTTVSPRKIKVHPDHGSLILYDKVGSEFKIHRDKVLNCPFEEITGKKHMYSLVVCLDSNIQDRIRNNEGNTVVYMPPTITQPMKYYGKLSNYKCVPHIFNDSVIQSQFVGFPSLARHKSMPIVTEGVYKFILKLDFWVEEGSNLYLGNKTMSSQNCNCKSCDHYRQRKPVYYYNKILNSMPINTDIANIILKYIDIKPYNGVDFNSFKKYLSKNHYRLHQEEQERLYYEQLNYYDMMYPHPDDMYADYDEGYDTDDRFCNGYEDDIW